jgi:subtilisin family serine protease
MFPAAHSNGGSDVSNWNNPVFPSASSPPGRPDPPDPFDTPFGRPGTAPPPAGAARPGCATYAGLILLSLWIIVVAFGDAGGLWVAEQARVISGDPAPTMQETFRDWIGRALLLGIPIGLLALFTGPPRYRAIYRAWALALGAGLIVSLVRLLSLAWNETTILLQFGLILVAILELAALLYWRGQRFAAGGAAGAVLAAGALVPLALAPWLMLGALGSPADIALNGLVAASVGALAGVLLGGYLAPRLAAYSGGPGWDIALGGWAAGIALLILGGSVAVGGLPLLLAISLPAFGVAGFALARVAPRGLVSAAGSSLPLALVLGALAAAPLLLTDEGELSWAVLLSLAALGALTTGLARLTLRRRGPDGAAASAAWLPIAVLVGGAAAGPLLFVDPAEMSLILGFADVPLWAFLAAALAAGAGWMLGIVLWAVRDRLDGPPALRTIAPVGAATVTVGLALYLLVGQPGFHGDKLFVILRDQAEVGGAAAITGRPERLRTVYTTLTAHADRTQARLRGELARHGITYRPYYLVNALEVEGRARLQTWLARQPEVDRVLASPHLRPLPVQAAPMAGEIAGPPPAPPWGIRAIGADRVWRELGVTGAGIVVGQSDSGVDGDHPALQARYRGRGGQDAYNWLDPWYGTRRPTDTGGHGTHTLGTIVGQDGIGVAPGAEWIGCVNLGRNLANPAYYLDCMQFMLAPYPPGGDPLHDGDPARAAHVLNNSWGCPPLEGCDPASLEPAVRALTAAGIFVVASAGNDGPECATVRDPLAIYDSAFTVGAADEAVDNIAYFSSRGPVRVDGSGRTKPEIFAPGVNILSALPGGTYEALEGTSMAGPHVAGTVALMWAAQPALIGDIPRTRQTLIETAFSYGTYGCADSEGTEARYRVVNAYRAVEAARAYRP